jgi:7-cyano-7-deazaguanine synthase
MVKKAVCLVSGGLDSCVSAGIAREQGHQIYALSFDYGQRHKKELRCAQKIAQSFKAQEHIILKIDLKRFGGSSLFHKKNQPLQSHHPKKIGEKIPSTYVPARNTVFLSLALAYAETVNADAIFIGVNSVDYSGYPDCRPEYLEAFQKMANLATKKGIHGKQITLEAPLLRLSKAEIIQKGVELNVPFKNTWSCYKGDKQACGRCDSCVLRLQGFLKVHVKDPISYSFYPPWYKIKKNIK